MPGIIRAEYLSYYNPARNSDKLFNIFLIEDADGTFSCLTENGRRGSNLVRRALCTRTERAIAESKFRQKLDDKRYHRDTPYRDEAFGANYSQIAKEYGSDQNQSESSGANRMSQPKPQSPTVQPSNRNVIAFPTPNKEKPREQPKQSGILNQEQFDSLEI
jgi:hypothetical protein